jgi:glucose dehydrogenase
VYYAPSLVRRCAVVTRSGRQIRRTPVAFDPAVPRVACCGMSNKGPAIYNGKVFRATIDPLDMDTGKPLWQFKTSSGINAQPITYTHNGKQHVAIQVGLGGVNASRMAAQLTNVPRGGSVWVFALMED